LKNTNGIAAKKTMKSTNPRIVLSLLEAYGGGFRQCRLRPL
jgi:hypothetical protein